MGYNDDYNDSNEVPQTKFNAGIAKLMRIDNIRKFIMTARHMDDYDNWYDGLFSWRSEINEKMNPEERIVAEKFEEEVGKQLVAYQKRLARMRELDGNVNRNKAVYGLDFIKKLKEYELWLGDVEKKYGFSMPDEEGVHDIISNMD